LRPVTRHFGWIYSALGLLAVLIPIYVLTFGDFWNAAQQQHLSRLEIPIWFIIGVLAGGIAAGSLAVNRRQDRDQ